MHHASGKVLQVQMGKLKELVGHSMIWGPRRYTFVGCCYFCSW